MDLAEAEGECRRLSKLIDAGIVALQKASRALAQAENTYRKARAEAWVTCPNDPPAGPREWTAARREAWVDGTTADLRMERDLAEGVRAAAVEAVRARRAQLSALQSLLAAHRSEAEFVRVAG